MRVRFDSGVQDEDLGRGDASGRFGNGTSQGTVLQGGCVMEQPAPKPPPSDDSDDTYNIYRPRCPTERELEELRRQWQQRYSGPQAPYPPRRSQEPPTWFEGEEGSPSYWHAVTMEEKRQSLVDEWNAKQDRTNYFWKVVAAIVIAVVIVIALIGG